ncbi:MAG: hypothetical protein F6K65_33495 [Moorea sp. SIO3C2]|nr:hypothetical protein [Moorena sp. SIO3C2]
MLIFARAGCPLYSYLFFDLATPDFFPTPDSRFPIPDSLFPAPYSLLPTPLLTT